MARRSARPALYPGKVQPLALVLELRRRRDDGPVRALDRRGAMGDESGPTNHGDDAGRQIRVQGMGVPRHHPGSLPLSGLRCGL